MLLEHPVKCDEGDGSFGSAFVDAFDHRADVGNKSAHAEDVWHLARFGLKRSRDGNRRRFKRSFGVEEFAPVGELVPPVLHLLRVPRAETRVPVKQRLGDGIVPFDVIEHETTQEFEFWLEVKRICAVIVEVGQNFDQARPGDFAVPT